MKKRNDVREGDVRMNDLLQQWGITKNGLKTRAERLGVTLIRPNNRETYWPVEHLELGHQYQEHQLKGGTYGDFPPLVAKASRRDTNDCLDPFGETDLIYSAAQTPARSWTTKQLARICNVSRDKVLSWQQGSMVRLGIIVLQKYRESERSDWYWRIGPGEPEIQDPAMRCLPIGGETLALIRGGRDLSDPITQGQVIPVSPG